jgi:hypothetical protein
MWGTRSSLPVQEAGHHNELSFRPARNVVERSAVSLPVPTVQGRALEDLIVLPCLIPSTDTVFRLFLEKRAN